MTNPAPGWYPEDATTLRYWDGTAWTEHRHPLTQETNPGQAAEATETLQATTVETTPEQGVIETESVATVTEVAPGDVTQAVPDQAYTTDGQAYTTYDQPYATNGQAYATNGQAYAQMNAAAVPMETNTVFVTQNQRGYANLQTDRSLLKFVLLSLITLGIYGIWVIARSAEDLNTIASRYDGQRTMNYWLLIFLIGPITLGIATLVWWTKMPDRTGAALQRRGYPKMVSGADFWLWAVLGSLIIVGPFIFFNKYLKAMNVLCQDYNMNG